MSEPLKEVYRVIQTLSGPGITVTLQYFVVYLKNVNKITGEREEELRTSESLSLSQIGSQRVGTVMTVHLDRLRNNTPQQDAQHPTNYRREQR